MEEASYVFLVLTVFNTLVDIPDHVSFLCGDDVVMHENVLGRTVQESLQMLFAAPYRLEGHSRG